VTYLRHPEVYSDRKWNDYGYRTLLGHALRRADQIVALSDSTRRDLAELCDVDEQRVWVIPHGLDERFHSVPEQEQETVLQRLQLKQPFVLYPMGTLDLRKNLERTLQGFAAAFPNSSDRPHLVLTGVGAMPSEFQEVVQRLDLEKHLRLETVRYPDELATLMSAAMWGMYTTLYEGFGLPPLEAMACGLPMLVSSATSCPEVVGDAALLVDPYEVDSISQGMRRLHEDGKLRKDLSQRGLQRAHSPAFRWSRAARQTHAAYRGDSEAFARIPQPLALNRSRAELA
ncbi:MAG: glycosyltransferase family 1 protein, partial [Planctomycetota bacterium]